MIDDRQRRAKKPVSALAGPYGHPIHPLLVTIPIGAWVLSFVFDLASHNSTDTVTFAKGAQWLVGLGIVGALAAALFGLLDLLAIPRATRAFTNVLVHLGLNLAITAAFVVSFALRRDQPVTVPTPAGLVVLSLVALLALGVSGWIGGRLVYRFGVRVADEGTQSEGFVTGDRPLPEVHRPHGPQEA